MRALFVIALFTLVGCDPTYSCGAFVYSESEGRCVCPPGFIENDDFTECLSLDAGLSGDGGVMRDAGVITDAGVMRDSQVLDAGESCTEGATMPCGTSDIGECAFGTQQCVSGAWAACEGAVEATAEVCNERDDDCDGELDEEVRITFYRDADGDGYGVAGDSLVACTAPSGYVARAGDCLDTNASVNPGQIVFFTTPITGVPEGVQFDYDCDSEESVQYSSVLACGEISCVVGTPGFWLNLLAGTGPAICGETRTNFITGCSSTCETQYETRTQGCR